MSRNTEAKEEGVKPLPGHPLGDTTPDTTLVCQVLTADGATCHFFFFSLSAILHPMFSK